MATEAAKTVSYTHLDVYKRQTTSLTSPVFLYIQCSKFTECVCGEQDFIFGIIRNDDFRPVNHRCGHESQFVCTKRKGIPFFDDQLIVRIVGSEEL